MKTTHDDVSCVEKVVEDGLCIGCGACAVLAGRGAIDMTVGSDGFIVPVVRDRRAVDDIAAEFDQVCPGRRVVGSARRDSLVWGPVVELTGGHAADPAIRYAGSSGGVLTALCEFLLSTGRVDAVATFGVDDSAPLRPHGMLIRDPAELAATASSRYCPSSPVALLGEVPGGERIAFVGKPCDVAAVRGLMEVDASVRAKVGVLLSFFCAGVSSFAATDELVRGMGHEPTDVTAFRYRGEGWPGRATATSGDRTSSMSYDDSWGGYLAGRRHERCKICPDGTGELADISCGDAWDIVGGEPSFEESDGRSVVLARTPLGAALLEAAVRDGFVVRDEYDAAQLELAQPFQVSRKRSVGARLVGRRAMGASVPRFRRLGLVANARRAGLRALADAARGAAFRARRDHPRRWHRLLARGRRR